jgi:membrane-bound serine protease (ClpP class)
MEKLTTTVQTLTISIAAVVAIAAVINRYLPHIPLFNAIILHPPNAEAETAGPKLRPGLGSFDSASPLAELYGMTGVAQSVLRPAGKARIGERLVDVVSNGPYIQAGTQIEVVEVAGNRIVVREV